MIVLDTHVLLWLAADPSRLSTAAHEAIDHEPERAISAISAQEIAYLSMRGRLELDRPAGRWVRDALEAHDIRALETDLSMALSAGAFDAASFPGDPADRIIYATALRHDAGLVSADARLRSVDPARLIW